MVLINADSFKKFIESLPKNPNGTSRVYSESDILHFIDAQPTAYNVEAVEAELEEKRDKRTGILRLILDDAIDIVKRGGIDES